MSQRVAIIEDDTDQARLIASWLSSYGYESTLFFSAELFLKALETSQFDLLLIDWLLPGLNGIQLVRLLAEKKLTTPIIFITGKNQDDDLATALHNGADDFVSKPISRTILIARIHAVMRRKGSLSHEVNPTYAIELDYRKNELIYAGQKLRLTPSEFLLLQLFTQSGSEVISRKDLADSLWKNEAKAEGGRALDLLISRLRKKLTTLSPSPGQLLNRYGQGYTFERNNSTEVDKLS